MNIGILKEDFRRERRIALTPAGVQTLISGGNVVYMEKDAGLAAHFLNEQYEKVGAQIAYSSDEIFCRSDIILKVSPPSTEICEKLMNSQTLLSALHLPIAKQQMIEKLLEKKVCAIGYELIEDEEGNLPILQVMSEIAGLLSVQVAARFLESSSQGRGIVLGGITGTPPATVIIIGAGIVGQTAARIAYNYGAEVIVLDKDLWRIRALANRFNYRIVTAIANEYNIKKVLQFADVVIGAVRVKGERKPLMISEEIVKLMKPGSIIIDVSIDEGGCFETSRPTTLEDPTYIQHNVTHYCVPNMPANVARTATYGLTNAMLPYLLELTQSGIANAIKKNKGLAKGVCTYLGELTVDTIANRFGIKPRDIKSLL